MDPTMLAGLARSWKNGSNLTRKDFSRFERLPDQGMPRDEIIRRDGAAEIDRGEALERWIRLWAVYHGDETHIDFIKPGLHHPLQSNPLHPDVWPSASKF